MSELIGGELLLVALTALSVTIHNLCKLVLNFSFCYVRSYESTGCGRGVTREISRLMVIG